MVESASVFLSSTQSIITESVGDSTSIQLQSMPWCVKLILRGDATDDRFASAVKQASGLAVPVDSNTQTRSESGEDTVGLLWMGPDEWLLRIESATDDTDIVEVTGASGLKDDAQPWVDKCRDALVGVHSAVVDVSDYYQLICMTGPCVFDVLEKGTPLNVRKSLRSAEQCAQTRFGNAPVLLSRNISAESLNLQVRSSFAPYVWQFLSDASLEYIDQ